MPFKVIVVAFILSILTATFETIGALGSGFFWDSNHQKSFSVFLILLGFGLSITTYVLMRKYVGDLIIGQSFFIGGAAIFAICTSIYINKEISINQIIGIMLVSLGALVIHKS